MKREMERKEQERKNSQKVEFVAGGMQTGTVAAAQKINIPLPGKSLNFLVNILNENTILRKFSFAVLQIIIFGLFCKLVVTLLCMVDIYELQVFLRQLMLWHGMVGRTRNQSGIRFLSMHNIYVCFL